MRAGAVLSVIFVVGACGAAPGRISDAGSPSVADAGAADAGAADAGAADAGAADAGLSGVVDARGPGRGFPDVAPWVSFYGSAAQMGDLSRVAATFRVINIDADPDAANFTDAQLAYLRMGGRNRVISYLNVGACERYRSYWDRAPAGFVSCAANTAAERGPYAGYPDETWMDPSNADYQRLIVLHVARRLAARGIDGFFLDNLELLQHGTSTDNGPCDARCAQGGLDLVARLRAAYPNLLIVMQNGTADVTRTGTTEGRAYPLLLDGITHEEVYAPALDSIAEQELRAWAALGLRPGGQHFLIGTEDYVGSCSATDAARLAYDKSRQSGFSPYATDESAGQRVVCFWGF